MGPAFDEAKPALKGVQTGGRRGLARRYAREEGVGGLLQGPGQRPRTWQHWAVLGWSTPWRVPARLAPWAVGELPLRPGAQVVFRSSWPPPGWALTAAHKPDASRTKSLRTEEERKRGTGPRSQRVSGLGARGGPSGLHPSVLPYLRLNPSLLLAPPSLESGLNC